MRCGYQGKNGKFWSEELPTLKRLSKVSKASIQKKEKSCLEIVFSSSRVKPLMVAL